ncbi:MAG: hypothetical protein ACI8TX_003719, partial [Hyphomicrobiaceae bacterium]
MMRGANPFRCVLTLLAGLLAGAAFADEGRTFDFEQSVQPVLRKYCITCHSTEKQKGDLDLERFTSLALVKREPGVWEHALEQIHDKKMPPKDKPRPSPEQTKLLTDWMQSTLDEVALANAGDPGQVTLRRLSNAEYDNAVRDLTGVDMRPTRAGEFPPDSVGGEGFANVGEAMPVTPGLVERYHQAARDVAARAVLLPTGLRFSPSPDRPEWTEEILKSLRNFHARHAGPNGEPPLAAHLAATLKHRDRLTRGGAADIAAVAAEEKLNATYLAALWAGLNGKSASPAEVSAQTKQWSEKAALAEAEKQRRQTALQSAKKAIESQWGSSKRVLAESKVAEAGSVPFESKVSVERGELLLLTVLPNENYGADSTLIEWTIRETTGDQRTWSVADLVPNLLKGNPWSDKHEARWSFLETTSTPVFLNQRHDSSAGRPELKFWNIGSEPSVFVNSAAEPIKVWTTLPARSVFVHPGQKRLVAIAWTSPIAGELSVAGRVADAHPSGGDGVSFELSHVAAPDLGQALADLGSASGLPEAGLPPDMLALVREKWGEATTDPTPVLAAIKAVQDQLFQGNYGKNAAIAVGNGFPAWEDVRCVVARERVQGAAREPLFRMVALPAQPDTFVIWDRLRLEGGDGPP